MSPSRSAPCSRRRPTTPWVTGCRWSSCCRPRRRSRWSGISARICSGRTGIATRRCAGSGGSRTDPSARRCSTSATSPGSGTFYRAEVLFLQGLHPRTPVADVPDLPRLVQRAQQLMMANRGRPEQSTTGNLRSGRQRVRVRAPGPAVPALRHPDPDRGVRTARSGAAELLVPALPTGPDGQRCSVSSRTARSSTLRETSDSTMTARRCARSKPTKLA